MPAEVACLKKLELMLDIVFSHNHEHVDLVGQTTNSHHKEFCALYPDCAKNKPHYQLHVPPAARRFKRIMACFATERKPKFTKEIAALLQQMCIHDLLV